MIKIMKLQDTSIIHVNYHNVIVSNPMGKMYNGTIVLELVKGSSDSTVILVFYPFILELCSISLKTYYSENYAGKLASALPRPVVIYYNILPFIVYEAIIIKNEL